MRLGVIAVLFLSGCYASPGTTTPVCYLQKGSWRDAPGCEECRPSYELWYGGTGCYAKDQLMGNFFDIPAAQDAAMQMGCGSISLPPICDHF